MTRQEETNIKELYRLLKQEDERCALSFARSWAAVQSRHEQRGRRRLMWSLAAAGLVLLSLGGAWLVLNIRAPKQVKPPETLVQQVSPAESVKILPPPALSPIRKPSIPANKRVVTKERRTSPVPQPDLALLSQWRSPTEFLLRTPGNALFRTVPRLGASWIESRTLVPEQKNDMEEQ
jgi:hypothetical protein